MDNEYIVKDHFQDILLSAIYNSVEEGCLLVFKGGTAIRKVYGIDRYSDDLDFTLNEGRLRAISANEYIQGLRDKCTGLLSPLYDVEMHIHRGQFGQYGIDAIVADAVHRSAKIHIEIKAAKVYMPCMERRIITPETTYFASVMHIDEIIAEKVRAVYTRRNIENIARDLVDMAFLASHGGRFDIELANKKLAEVSHRPFSAASFSRRLRVITDDVWNRDLEGIMSRIPDRRGTIAQVAELLKIG
ncbi:MAG: nucleotidyl transferase AbiEii/AbiGii toxin family protein [Candidatus Micrarchaeaceae archaeon]